MVHLTVQPSHVHLVHLNTDFQGGTYGDLTVHMLAAHGVLCVGLRRRPRRERLSMFKRAGSRGSLLNRSFARLGDFAALNRPAHEGMDEVSRAVNVGDTDPFGDRAGASVLKAIASVSENRLLSTLRRFLMELRCTLRSSNTPFVCVAIGSSSVSPASYPLKP